MEALGKDKYLTPFEILAENRRLEELADRLVFFDSYNRADSLGGVIKNWEDLLREIHWLVENAYRNLGRLNEIRFTKDRQDQLEAYKKRKSGQDNGSTSEN